MSTISGGDTQALWHDYRATRDRAIRDRLILTYAPLVKFVAGRLGSSLPSHVDEQDLVSYGLLGLIGAIERFDPAREIKFEYKHTPAKVTTEQANKMGIKEVIGEFQTGGFAAASGVNIRVVAEKVNGAIVKPKETFSLNKYTGPRGTAQGYVEAGIIENGIPAGGLFTGAEVPKTEQQAIIWGGITDEQFDPCYHEACDTLGNHDRHALEVNSDLVAFAQLTFAFSTESVNGVRGQRVPGPRVHLPRPAGAQGTFVESSGGHGPAMPTS